jgi:hypothetical protein
VTVFEIPLVDALPVTVFEMLLLVVKESPVL